MPALRSRHCANMSFPMGPRARRSRSTGAAVSTPCLSRQRRAAGVAERAARALLALAQRSRGARAPRWSTRSCAPMRRFAWRSGTRSRRRWEDVGLAPRRRRSSGPSTRRSTSRRRAVGAGRPASSRSGRCAYRRSSRRHASSGWSIRASPAAAHHAAHGHRARDLRGAAAHRPRHSTTSCASRRRRARRPQRPLRRRLARSRPAPARGGRLAAPCSTRSRSPGLLPGRLARLTSPASPSASTPRCGRAIARCPTPRPPPRCCCG